MHPNSTSVTVATATTRTSQSPVTRTTDGLQHALYSSSGLVILGCFVVLVVLGSKGQRKKGRLARGFFGGKPEKERARKTALHQMRERQHNAASLWIGQPTGSLFTPAPIYLPDAQRGVAVLGAPGTGKTVSVIDQAAYSVIDQGFPMILWDFKYPRQTSRIAGYAASKGYAVHIFAPGYPESGELNPIEEFLASDSDSLMARQFAEVMNANFKRSGMSSEDGFFGPAGDQATEAILMLTRGTQYPDIMMAQALASRTDLARLVLEHKERINPWVLASFGQLISSAGSEKTVSSILATANLNLTRFIKADILPSLCGETTIPTFLQGKTLLVLGLDREKRDVLAPLIATVLHMLVAKNVVRPRKDPLFLFADELPTLYLPALHNWLNENREDGLCTLIGCQNVVQMEKIYGRELSRAILGGCATKVAFNPQDYDSAKLISDYLGEKEIDYKTRSKGRSGGKGNTSYSEHVQTRPLMAPAEILRLPTGRSIILNPHFQHAQESYVPLLEGIRLSRAYGRIVKESGRDWDELRRVRIDSKRQRVISNDDLKARYDEADRLLPATNGKAVSARRTELPIEQLLGDDRSPLFYT